MTGASARGGQRAQELRRGIEEQLRARETARNAVTQGHTAEEIDDGRTVLDFVSTQDLVGVNRDHHNVRNIIDGDTPGDRSPCLPSPSRQAEQKKRYRPNADTNNTQTRLHRVFSMPLDSVLRVGQRF